MGGSSGMGNRFVDVGYLDSYYDTDAFIHPYKMSHLIVSYNLGYSTKKDWGFAGIYGNEVQYALVEYNIFHDMQANHHRALIGFKGDIFPCEGGMKDHILSASIIYGVNMVMMRPGVTVVRVFLYPAIGKMPTFMVTMFMTVVLAS